MSTPRPRRVTDLIQWHFSAPGRRWAREDSGALIGTGRQRSQPRAVRPPGARAVAQRTPPARLARKRHLLWNEEKKWAHPPHPHIHKKLEPWRSVRNDPAAAFNLHGQRVGELTGFLDRPVRDAAILGHAGKGVCYLTGLASRLRSRGQRPRASGRLD